MSNELEEALVDRASRYAEFGGILIGFSISIAVILLALADEKILRFPLYSYSLAAFIYSALAFFNTYTWYGRVIEKSTRQRWHFLIGTCFYCTGYWGILLGLVYLTTLIVFSQTLNYPFLISFAFLVYTFLIDGYEFMWEILKGSEKLTGIILLGLLIITIYLAISTIPKEPFCVLLGC